MTQQLLLALGVIALGIGYQGVALAIDCPSQPQQTGKDWEGEVNAAMAKIGPVSGGEVKTKAKAVTQDLLGKLPDAGKIYLEQMRYATICSSIRDDKSLSESEKRKQMREYELETQKAIQQQAPKTKQSTGAPPLKQSRKGKESGTQFRVKPPVPPFTPAETKQPEAITCGPSLLTKRPAEKFVSYWVSVVKELYKARNKQYHDLEHLMEVGLGMGIPREAGPYPGEWHQEAIFTLRCLVKKGYLTLEDYNPPSKYRGEFDNLKIIFVEPMMPIPE